jgi:RNA polymerase sigma-70 factor (ECF subfamily)
MDPSPPPGPSDRSLLARLRDGSQGAAGELYDRYAQRLLALARAKCGADLAARVDVEDIVQSVFGSFFRGAQQGFYEAPPGEELWGLLLVIALNKIRAKGAYHRAAKRDVRKTQGGDALDAGGYDPPADDAAAAGLLRLVLDEALGQLPERNREIVRLRIEGYEVAEVAEQTGRSKRTVERVLQDFRKRMTESLGEGRGDG